MAKKKKHAQEAYKFIRGNCNWAGVSTAVSISSAYDTADIAFREGKESLEDAANKVFRKTVSHIFGEDSPIWEQFRNELKNQI
jgi:hypothetical protein